MRHEIISLIQAQVLAKTHFELTLPLTLATLKTALRKQQATWHPDRHPGQEEQAADKFKAFMNAYELLTGCMAAFKESDVFEHTVKATDGTLLSELGLGLGPLVNARDCEQCDHKGYSITFELTWAVCEECDEQGIPLIIKPCRECDKGKFKLRSGRMVDCRRCKGTGQVKFKRKLTADQEFRRRRSGLFGFGFGGFGDQFTCGHCDGTKKRKVDDKLKPVYHRCVECKGSGEIRIFNPVIRKGALTNKSKRF